MLRSVWWALAVATLAFTAWNGLSLTMFDVSMACSKIGEGGSYHCDDRAIDVLGVWPLVAVGLLLATPPAVAAIAMRQWVSWLAVATLVVLLIAGVVFVTHDSYLNLLVLALPMAVIGSVSATFQRTSLGGGGRKVS
ncbi:ABC transporter permease [Rhodococcus sp. IEGM 1330]|uniref:ABC transporter permease n=1 Tax=Rhodococcus sp. IEGM 1330 TaxID=3082225 RepID=UPI0029556B59|nr:ABC transporter permease [Rhodococcus sp. IEGM 1330]MDV8022021.1 ABC transporter permease [Rhodococcus sp. IEGM 1330]